MIKGRGQDAFSSLPMGDPASEQGPPGAAGRKDTPVENDQPTAATAWERTSNMEYLPGAAVTFDRFRGPPFLGGTFPLPGQPGETFFSRPKKVLSATFYTLLSIRYFDSPPGW